MLEKSREIDILDYLRVIWKRGWLIALLFFLTAAITFAVSSLAEKVYEAEIAFRIMGRQGNGSTALSGISSSTLTALGVPGGDRELQTYSHILRSKNMIGQAIDALPYLMDKYSVPQRSGLSGKIKDMLKPYNKDVKERMSAEEFRRRLLLKKLRKSVTVRQSGGDVLSVRVRWDDPKSAAAIADELGKAFIEYDRAARQEAAARTLRFIQRALRGAADGEPGVERKLTEAEKKLRDFKERHKTVAIQEEARKLIEKLAEAEDMLSLATIARRTTEARLSDVQKQLAEQDQMALSAQTVVDNPIAQYLQKEMAQLEIQAQSLGAEMGEANPELREIESQIAEHKKRVRQILENNPKVVSQETSTANPLYQYLRQEEINCIIDIAVSKTKETAIQRRITALEKELTQMPDAEMRLASLTREVETYNKMYATLRQSESEARLARESITTNISILDEPDPPLQPAAPKIALNTAIGGVMGLMLGFGLAFLLEYIKRVRSLQQN